MKKITIGMLSLAVVASFAVGPQAYAKHAQVPGQPYTPHENERRPCIAIDSNLSFGAKDKTTNGSVVNMQVFLKLYNFLQVEPTGYFGVLTRQAVKDFQKANGLPATGFFGPLSRGVMKKLTCADDMPTPPPTTTGITYSVRTDKQQYNANEAVTIIIAARNTTNEVKTLNFTNGCQTDYTIDNAYTYLAARLCIMALTSVDIPAQGTHTWTMTHDAAEYAIPAGTHTLVAKVGGAEVAKTTFTVASANSQPSVTVVSPNGGETLKIGSSTQITWKSFMPYPTFAPVRYNIILQRKYECSGQVCPAIAYAPYTIAEQVLGDSYTWNVGTVLNNNNQSVPAGQYWIQVCMEGNQTCDMSENTFTITQ